MASGIFLETSAWFLALGSRHTGLSKEEKKYTQDCSCIPDQAIASLTNKNKTLTSGKLRTKAERKGLSFNCSIQDQVATMLMVYTRETRLERGAVGSMGITRDLVSKLGSHKYI